MLYHGFGLSDQEHLKTVYRNGNVIFHFQTKEDKSCFSECVSLHVIEKGFKERMYRTVSIGLKPVYLKQGLTGLIVRIAGLSYRNGSGMPEKKAMPGY